MATEKVSLTLDRELLKQTRKRVGKRGLSSYVDAALRKQLQHDRLRALLDEMDREHGRVPAVVSRKVAREWPSGDAPRPRARRRG